VIGPSCECSTAVKTCSLSNAATSDDLPFQLATVFLTRHIHRTHTGKLASSQLRPRGGNICRIGIKLNKVQFLYMTEDGHIDSREPDADESMELSAEQRDADRGEEVF